MPKQKLLIVSGPSGAGKTTLLKRLFRRAFIKEHFIESVSYTTRSPRPGEKKGRDYKFISYLRFEQLIKEDAFIERDGGKNIDR